MIIKPIKDGRFFIKWMHLSYLDEIVQIESTSNENLWRKEEIRSKMFDENMAGYIITDMKVPVGYMVLEKHPYDQIVELLNLVILPEYRKQGLGTLLLKQARKFIRHGPEFESIQAHVRDTNLPAHLFLKYNRYLSDGVVKSHFKNGEEYSDSYLFVLRDKGSRGPLFNRYYS